MKSKSPWRPFKTAKKIYRKEIDVWMSWGSSPLTMGMGDSFRVTDVHWLDEMPPVEGGFYPDGLKAGWYHVVGSGILAKEMQLNADYITHWMPVPKEPR